MASCSTSRSRMKGSSCFPILLIFPDTRHRNVEDCVALYCCHHSKCICDVFFLT